jgi:hypothetical protein
MQTLKYILTVFVLLLFLVLFTAQTNHRDLLADPSELCEKIKSDLKTDCIAITTKNPSLCSRLPRVDAANCINTIITSGALKEKNPALCSYTENVSMDSCYWTLAIQTGDHTMCNNISNKRDSQSCLAFTTKDRSHCRTEYPDSCIYYAELSKGNVSYCETISGTKRASCFSELAALSENISLCEQLKTDKKLNDGLRETYSDSCLYKIAANSGRTETCSRISSEDKKLMCRALVSSEPQICELFGNSFSRDNCLFQLALKTANIAYIPASLNS